MITEATLMALVKTYGFSIFGYLAAAYFYWLRERDSKTAISVLRDWNKQKDLALHETAEAFRSIEVALDRMTILLQVIHRYDSNIIDTVRGNRNMNMHTPNAGPDVDQG